MRLLLILFLLACRFPAIAQKVGPLLIKEVIIGTRLSNAAPVAARLLDLGKPIKTLEPGADDHSIITTTVGGSSYKLMGIDFTEAMCKWTFAIKSLDLRFSKDVIVYDGAEDHYFFSKTTGKKLFTMKAVPGMVAAHLNMFITSYHAWNMLTGKVVWDAELYPPYNDNQVLYSNDTTVYVSWGGLRKINLLRGQAWYYPLGVLKNGPGVLPVLSATPSGVGIGIMVPMGGRQPVMTEESPMCSKLLYDSITQRIYFASSEKLICLDENGKSVWEQVLPKGKASYSILIRDGESVVMLNTGIGVTNIGNRMGCDPFIARFDARTGVRSYLNVICKDDYVRQNICRNDTFFVLTSKKLLLYKISDGNLIASADFDAYKNKVGSESVEPSEYFLQLADSNYYDLKSRSHYIVRMDNGFYKFDNSLKLVETIPTEVVWKKTQESGDYQVLRRGETMVLQKNGKAVMRLNIAGRTKLVGHHLLVAVANNLYVTDVSYL
jgi:hypothetical protein